jgi:hypothetical protein
MAPGLATDDPTYRARVYIELAANLASGGALANQFPSLADFGGSQLDVVVRFTTDDCPMLLTVL